LGRLEFGGANVLNAADEEICLSRNGSRQAAAIALDELLEVITGKRVEGAGCSEGEADETAGFAERDWNLAPARRIIDL
jgi:hypothetical protein